VFISVGGGYPHSWPRGGGGLGSSDVRMRFGQRRDISKIFIPLPVRQTHRTHRRHRTHRTHRT